MFLNNEIIYHHCLNLCLLHDIRRVQVSREGYILNGSHQLLFYADGVNILDKKLHTIKKTGNLIIDTKENGVEIYADKLSTWSCHYM